MTFSNILLTLFSRNLRNLHLINSIRCTACSAARGYVRLSADRVADLHHQVTAHAGHTSIRGAQRRPCVFLRAGGICLRAPLAVIVC